MGKVISFDKVRESARDEQEHRRKEAKVRAIRQAFSSARAASEDQQGAESGIEKLRKTRKKNKTPKGSSGKRKK